MTQRLLIILISRPSFKISRTGPIPVFKDFSYLTGGMQAACLRQPPFSPIRESACKFVHLRARPGEGCGRVMRKIVFLDTEVGVTDKRVHDIGAVTADGKVFHSGDIRRFSDFLSGADCLCGHNILRHDLKYLAPALDGQIPATIVDTLYWSPLLFPRRPYHRLLKDDKLQSEELNNPLNDAFKAMELLTDETDAFNRLPKELKQVFYSLLHDVREFRGFFPYVGYVPGGRTGFLRRAGLRFGTAQDAASDTASDTAEAVRTLFRDRICAHAPLEKMVRESPVALAYALALISAGDGISIVPPWVTVNYTDVYHLLNRLCSTPCAIGCPYCRNKLDIRQKLHQYFGFPHFRTYNGEPLQEKAVQAAVDGRSLLAVFPTGGGKSLTFQLPALMAGDNSHGLTVVISPLQSLMKDQVDQLSRQGITGAATVNGLLDPIGRADAIGRVADGSVSLLYISPEMLRSRTIEKLLLARNVVRFVIDEAHCFSAWGHDFRVDYLYIGDFIAGLQARKPDCPIAVSCFTATAKQKVISDIRDYFHKKLNLELAIFASDAVRENLHYTVLHRETEEEKYAALRNLIEMKDCPAIVYVSRTKRAVELADKLTRDGFPARPFHGKMRPDEKIANQDAFMQGDVRLIVATSAFGMGVDKKDIGLIVHYDISDSLENYIQEAGRAGRDADIQADCYVLFNDTDLDRHFLLLNQTKLSISEIQQIWRAVKVMGGRRSHFCCSALELAREAGWDSHVPDVETRVRTAVAALEEAGYLRRGNNVPHIYATGILAKNMSEAASRIDRSPLYPENRKLNAKRLIKSLISERSVARAGNDDAESRVDYLADILGMPKSEVIELIQLMRQDGLLADTMDMAAYIRREDTQKRSSATLDRFARLENFLLRRLDAEEKEFNLKELNAQAEAEGPDRNNLKDLNTLLYFLTIKHDIRKNEIKGSSLVRIQPQADKEKLLEKQERRIDICRFILKDFHARTEKMREEERSRNEEPRSEYPVEFSLIRLYNDYRASVLFREVSLQEVEDALLYLSKIGVLHLEGGFLVLYNAMEISRLVRDNKIRYKAEDYAALNDFYRHKIQQIHIVGEFANMVVRDYAAAMQFVNDYFQMDFRQFISRYFKGERKERLNRNITAKKYQRLFGSLSPMQRTIIEDKEAQYIVVAAGPGSGKTRVLVHKLAALLMLEDVKHEQLLMLTFSRAAATEFKSRLRDLIGNAASFVEIRTFHSYCFQLLGRIGSLEGVQDVVKDAAELIDSGNVEQERIAKCVLVIDEAQDMNPDEYRLVEALMKANEGMRVIAVGDDDQNIYAFRGSDSAYMRKMITEKEARLYELTENFRSKANIVRFANLFVRSIRRRLKNREITAVSKESGEVVLFRHRSPHMEEAVVENLLHARTDGTACVMTRTNEEALRLLGLLLHKGISARLIQSNDGFSLYDLAEVRFFLKKLDAAGKTSIIREEDWDAAKAQLSAAYADSACMENCRKMLADFERSCQKKYRSDLEEFLRESKYEDFYPEDRGLVLVSTIHKTKGREFDQVHLLIDDEASFRSDEERRTFYVGLTRAKDALYLHCHNDLPDRLKAPFVRRVRDDRLYPDPEELAFQLGFRDVVLDCFKGRKRELLKLHAGMPLSVCNGFIAAEIQGRTVPLARFSRSCAERLRELEERGYRPCRAEVRFVVAWKGENETEETAVVLPDLCLRKEPAGV